MLEKNTYTTSLDIESPLAETTAYVADGMKLNDWTLFSRMQEQLDPTTWLGTASGYQKGLIYHVRHRDLGDIQIVEWHCGFERGTYHHVYPMVLFRGGYFTGEQHATTTHFQWISFVDPARRNAAIAEGLPTVHRSEVRSLKAHLERARGLRAAAPHRVELAAHTVYADAPLAAAAPFLADPANLPAWNFMIYPVAGGDGLADEYGNPIAIQVRDHDLGAYHLIEHDTVYESGAHVVRAPLLVIPAAYAFAQPQARGVILHRVSAWPMSGGRTRGKLTVDDYNTECLNSKRLLEGQAGNMESYALGNSYLGVKD